ncbi:hypothetical protein F0562_024746 [Nyssa sinensis]|uniref:Uncharacterized protein n=1 Tax=Nyssa sinensis TaxID=561372 RepID=A0A5J5BAX5_9ASTE|nr:hypothetical protein F0562_024746 [Nyssa sinensis]
MLSVSTAKRQLRQERPGILLPAAPDERSLARTWTKEEARWDPDRSLHDQGAALGGTPARRGTTSSRVKIGIPTSVDTAAEELSRSAAAVVVDDEIVSSST